MALPSARFLPLAARSTTSHAHFLPAHPPLAAPQSISSAQSEDSTSSSAPLQQQQQQQQQQPAPPEERSAASELSATASAAAPGAGAQLAQSTMFRDAPQPALAAALASTSRASYNSIARASQSRGSSLGATAASLQRTSSGGAGAGAAGLGGSGSSLAPAAGGGAAAATLSSLLAAQPQREVYQESLATGGFLRVGVGWGRSGGAGGGSGAGAPAEGGGAGASSTVAAFMRARQLGRRSGAMGGAGGEGEGAWSLEDSLLLPGETLFTPAQRALGRVTRLCEALLTGLLLMLVLQLAQLAGAPSVTFMATLAPLAPSLRLAQYVLACLALVGSAHQTLAARAWVKGPGGMESSAAAGGSGERGGGGGSSSSSSSSSGNAPPPATVLHRARYLTLSAMAHCCVVVTVLAALPYDNKIRVLANRAAAAAAAAGAGGYNWASLGSSADGAIASWTALAYLRFASAGTALVLSTLASLSPAEAALLAFSK